MPTNRSIATILLACCVLLAGCPGVEPGDETSVTFLGTMNGTDSGFEMDGRLVQAPGTGGFQTYDNVELKLYAANETVLHSQELGSLHQELNVSVSISNVPEYVIFTSPDFWEDADTAVNHYERTDYSYTVRSIASEDELPVAAWKWKTKLQFLQTELLSV